MSSGPEERRRERSCSKKAFRHRAARSRLRITARGLQDIRKFFLSKHGKPLDTQVGSHHWHRTSSSPKVTESTWHTMFMSSTELDRLGDRLRADMTARDLKQLDAYRRGFRAAYDVVVDLLRSEVGLEVSGRPAKSTAAIVDKLRRGSMRLTQMQDIAGCRVVVPDITAQSRLVSRLETMFDVTIIDRRAKPSHGYRAVHVIARRSGLPVEIQLRTDLQHVWAELSEKLADTFGISLKYGGGPKDVRNILDDYANLIAKFEQHLDLDGSGDGHIAELKKNIRQAMISLSSVLSKQP